MPPLLLLLCLAHPANPLPLLGLDTGNPAADREASMWLAALVATLSAAIPVAFLSTGLGFRRRREVAGLGSGGLEWVHRVVRQQQS